MGTDGSRWEVDGSGWGVDEERMEVDGERMEVDGELMRSGWPPFLDITARVLILRSG
jgi:hypothetical protein